MFLFTIIYILRDSILFHTALVQTGKLVRGRLKGNKIEIAFNCKKKSYMKTEKIRLF